MTRSVAFSIQSGGYFCTLIQPVSTASGVSPYTSRASARSAAGMSSPSSPTRARAGGGGSFEIEDEMASFGIALVLAEACGRIGGAMASLWHCHRFSAPDFPASDFFLRDSISLRYSDDRRGESSRLSAQALKGESTASRHSAHSSGVSRAQRANTRSLFGMVATGVSYQALHSSRKYAPTSRVVIASTLESEAKSCG